MRNGQWVESDQGVGIFIREREPVNDVTEWVHLTNADGTTLAQLPADRCSNLRVARASSIPAARIEHLSAEQLEKLGYVD